MTSGRRPDVGLPDVDIPDVGIQVDRPSSRGNNTNKNKPSKPSKWGEVCGSVGGDPLGPPSFCFSDEICQRLFPCKSSKCSTKKLHTKLITGLITEGLEPPEPLQASEVKVRSSKDFDFDFGVCVCFDGASQTVPSRRATPTAAIEPPFIENPLSPPPQMTTEKELSVFPVQVT